jgi:protocatechuate 3,4-dioxygenase beta subunit
VGASERASTCRRLSIGSDSAETFTIEPGREVRGRCLIGRRAAAKTELRLSFRGLQSRRPYSIPLGRREHKIVESIKTDSDGRFTFSHIAPGDYVIEVRLPNGRVHRTTTITIPVRKASDGDDSVQIRDISIPAGVDVAVRVHTLSGLPVSKASISIWQERDANDEQPIAIEARSDREGNVVLSGADSKLPLRLTCTAQGFVSATLGFDVPPREATCVLEKFASMRGEVRDDKGAGRAGATVSIRGLYRRATTDAHGAFVFSNLVAGEYDLRATLPGFRTAHAVVSVAAEENKETRAIELAPGDVINGRVRDAESGMPVPNALIRIIDPPGAGDVTSDDTGGFSLTADSTTTMVVEASAAGYASVQQMRIGPTSAEGLLVIDLPRPGRLEVVVWDEDANEACIGCSVHVSLRGAMRSAITDASGLAVFDDATPGEYQLTRDFARAGSSSVHVSGGGQWRSAVVKPQETTRVRIGEPATPIAVTLTPPPPTSWRLRAVCPPLVTFADSDAAGIYVVPKRDSACTLSVVDQTRSTYVGTISEEFHESIFQIAIPSGIVTATFSANGRPIVGANVLLTKATGQLAASAITLSDGSFEMQFVSPGIYVIASPGIAETRTISVTPGGKSDAGTISVGRYPQR